MTAEAEEGGGGVKTRRARWICDKKPLEVSLETERKIQATEMRWFRRLFGISYTNRGSNKEVRNSIRHAIGPYQDCMETVRKLNLRWSCHIIRSRRLTKRIL